MIPIVPLRRLATLVFSLTLWLLSAPALAQQRAEPAPVSGVVTRVVDGDTLLVAPNGQPPLTVRLRDIDAPEICQPHGPEARAALEEYALGQAVTMRIVARDTHGRTVARVATAERDLSVRMVEEGHAWSVRSKYDRGPLVKQERMAKALGRGIHATAGHVLPWDFRRRNGPCKGAAPAAAAAALPAAAVAAVPQRSAVPAATPATAAYRCDGRTHCSQMRSCEEATWFLRNCPGTQMDGNRDGIPCERQWCTR